MQKIYHPLILKRLYPLNRQLALASLLLSTNQKEQILVSYLYLPQLVYHQGYRYLRQQDLQAV